MSHSGIVTPAEPDAAEVEVIPARRHLEPSEKRAILAAVTRWLVSNPEAAEVWLPNGTPLACRRSEPRRWGETRGSQERV